MAEERVTAAEGPLDERRAHEAAESGAAQAVDDVQSLKSQLQKLQAAHSAAEAQWEAQRIAGAVATASALDEASRWEAEATRWEAEAARWEAEARDQAEQVKVLERQLEREVDNLLDEFCDTEDGYRKVIEKQRRARYRAERQVEAAEGALEAAREVAEAELSRGPGRPVDELAQEAEAEAEQETFLPSSIRMGSVGQSVLAQPEQLRRDPGSLPPNATSLHHGLGLGAVPTTPSPVPHNQMRADDTNHLEKRLRKIVSDDEVAAARARIAERAGLKSIQGFSSSSKIDAAALVQDSAYVNDKDAGVELSQVERSTVGLGRAPSTAALSLTAERLRARFDPVGAVTKVLEDVDTSRHELARLENEHQQVNKLLREAIADEGRGSSDQSPHPADEKSQQSTRLRVREHIPSRPISRSGAAPRRLDPGPDLVARRRLATGRSEWSSDSESDDPRGDTARQQQDQGRSHRHEHRNSSGRTPQRPDPWVEVASLDTYASEQPPLETSYRDASLSRRIDTAVAEWDFDNSRNDVRPEPKIEWSNGLGIDTAPLKRRGAGGKRRTARSMYELPAATGRSRW